MRYKRRALLAWTAGTIWSRLASPALAASAPATVTLDDNALAADPNDAEPALRAALVRLPPAGGTIIIPPGTWRFARTDGVAIPVAGRANVTIASPGATLLFRGTTRPFAFTDCSAPMLRGLTFDWERPPFSQGEVVAVAPDQMSVDVRIDPAFPVDGSETVRALQTMQPGTALIARGGIDNYGAVAGVSQPAAQTLRLRLRYRLSLHAGDIVILRHQVYAASLVSFRHCRDITVENVTMHAGPGMGVVCGQCDTATIRHLTVAPPPGSPRLMSLTADATHFADCRGDIVVDDCLMTAMGDDCVNVHSRFYEIAAVPDRRTVRIAAPANTGFGPSPASPRGDRFDFTTPRYEPAGDASVVAEEVQAGQAVLHFDRDLPAALGPGDLVLDAEALTRTRITGCRFPGNRARGVLAHSHAVIERCSFAGQSGPAVLLSVEPHFSEGPLVQDVTIRDNDIRDVSRVGNGGAVTIEALVKGDGNRPAPDDRPVQRDITIERNRFAGLHGPALAASSVRRLTIRANRIEEAVPPAMTLAFVGEVRIEGNHCAPPARVVAAESDRSGISLEGNSGLAMGAP